MTLQEHIGKGDVRNFFVLCSWWALFFKSNRNYKCALHLSDSFWFGPFSLNSANSTLNLSRLCSSPSSPKHTHADTLWNFTRKLSCLDFSPFNLVDFNSSNSSLTPTLLSHNNCLEVHIFYHEHLVKEKKLQKKLTIMEKNKEIVIISFIIIICGFLLLDDKWYFYSNFHVKQNCVLLPTII